MIPTKEQIRKILAEHEDHEVYEEADFFTDDGFGMTIQSLVAIADENDLFGDDVEITFWPTTDGDNIGNGGLFTLDFVGGGYTGPRFASRHQDWRDLVDSREATGLDLCSDIIRVAAVTVERLRPKVQVLHGRHPDMGCEVDVYVNDVKVEAETEDVDPGSGYSRSDWDERIAEAEKDTSKFGQAVLAELHSAEDSPYIEDED